MTGSASQRTIDMSGILTETFRIMNSNFYLLLFFILAINTPVYSFRQLFPWSELYSVQGATTAAAFRWGFDIFTTLFSLFTTIGIAHITQQYLDGKPTTFRSVFLFCMSRIDDVVWTYLVLLAIGIVKTLALFIPGIIFANTSSFALFASALRQTRGTKAIDYSEYLVQGQWWNIFGYQLFFFLIIFGSTIAIWIITRNSQRKDFFTLLAYQSINGALGNFAVVWQVLFFRRVDDSIAIQWESYTVPEIITT